MSYFSDKVAPSPGNLHYVSDLVYVNLLSHLLKDCRRVVCQHLIPFPETLEVVSLCQRGRQISFEEASASVEDPPLRGSLGVPTKLEE